MSEGFVGEIRMFGGNFAPRCWALCKGQLVPTANNDALFTLLGTIYGGDGVNTFGLPDFRGRIPVHSGNSTGPGLPHWNLGQIYGAETSFIDTNKMPPHTHTLSVSDTQGTSGTPYNNQYGKTTGTDTWFYKEYDSAQTGQLNSDTMGATGGSQAHTNMMPSMGLSFIICMQGIYPQQND